MRKRRFNPRESTKSYIFLPPMLNIDTTWCQRHLLINAYLYNEDINTTNDMIYLHYEYQDLEGSFARLENNFKELPEFLGMYDPDKYTTIFYFSVPDIWYEDFLLFKESKYSKISEALKRQILLFMGLGEKSDIYQVLYRDPAKRREMEENLDVCLPKEAELASKLDLEVETYRKENIINNPSKLNPIYWEAC